MTIAGNLVKISRYNERFWVRDVREIQPGVYVGTVDNELMASNPFKIGDQISFTTLEVLDVREHRKPQLSVVQGKGET
jgi:hypothetical protein